MDIHNQIVPVFTSIKIKKTILCIFCVYMDLNDVLSECNADLSMNQSVCYCQSCHWPMSPGETDMLCGSFLYIYIYFFSTVCLCMALFDSITEERWVMG